MLNNVKVYFFVRRSTVKGKRGSFNARVCIGGKLLVTSVKALEMYPSEFDVKTQNPKKNCPLYFEATEFMLGMRKEIMRIHNDYESRRKVFTIDDLKRAVQEVYYKMKHPGQPVQYKTLTDVYQEFLRDQQQQVGSLISRGTYELRRRYMGLIENAVKELGLKALPICNYETHDIEKIQTHLLAQTYNKNYVGRVMQVVSMVFRYGKKKKHLTENPCEDTHKIKIDKSPNLVWLEPEELDRWWELDLSEDPEVERIRDAFYFCCYTGLATGDYELLNPMAQERLMQKAQTPKRIEPGEIFTTRQGRILMGRRRKTGTQYRVPLLPEAEKVLQKYGGLEGMPYNLPETGNVLNLIARQAGIRKKLRFHTARKSKANLLLNVKKIHPYYAIEIMGWKKIEEATPYTQVSMQTLADQLHGQAIGL